MIILTIPFQIPTKLYFGVDEVENVPLIAQKYGKRSLLVTTPNVPPLDSLFNRIKDLLRDNGFEVVHFDKVVPNPTTTIIETGIQTLQENKIDFVLSVGGGSSIDTAKSICLLNDQRKINWDNIFSTYGDPHGEYEPISKEYIPHIAIPTTAGTGSEITQASVLSMGEDKNTIYHPLNRCDDAILDPKLLLTLPAKLTAATGFDAFSHAFESYIHPEATPFGEMASLKAIHLVKDYLVKAVGDLKNIEYREKLLLAQTLSGIALSNAGASTPHPLSEIIGGITGISHGEALALVFPSFISKQYTKDVKKFAHVARIFDPSLEELPDKEAAIKLADCIEKFLKDIHLYSTFEDYTITEEQFQSITGSPILGFLPFGSKEELQDILFHSKKSR